MNKPLRIYLPVVLGFMLLACKKAKDEQPLANPVEDPPERIKEPVDPPLAATVGFFMEHWQPRNYQSPGTFVSTIKPGAATVTISVDKSQVLGKVPATLLGNNANTWMTQIITEPALMQHLKNNPPGFIRFPGGSISDVFFWNAEPGAIPVDAPGQLLNAEGMPVEPGYWYGKNNAGWTLSVDNYYSMLQQTGNKGLITINYGYARYGRSADPVAEAAHMAANWVRYDNGRTRYWEIGNENFGSWEAGYRINRTENEDGQPEFLTGALYATHFKVFADSMRKAAGEVGHRIYIGAVLVDAPPAPWETPTFKTWNSGVLPGLGNLPDFYVVHSYYTPYEANSSAAEILSSGTTVTRNMMQYLKQQFQLYGVAEKPVALDEWNIFAKGSRQMVSHISGLHAVSTLAELLKQQFGFAARWDLANGWDSGNDHGLFSQGDEPDGIPRWTPRPAFYYLYFFQRFLGDRSLQATSSSSSVEVYASSFSSGETSLVLMNMAATAVNTSIKIDNFLEGNQYHWYILTGASDNNEFSRKVLVNGAGTSLAAGGPEQYRSLAPYAAPVSGGIRIALPARSAAFIVVDKK